MDTPAPAVPPPIRDKWTENFLTHLATDRGASVYTQRNYRQALHGICALASGRTQISRRRGNSCSAMISGLMCGFSGRNNLSRAATQLRFSRAADVLQISDAAWRGGNHRPSKTSRCRNWNSGCREFLTNQQMEDLLAAPAKLLASAEGRKRAGPPDFGGSLPARRGGAGDDLFLRPAHQRALRAARGGHRFQRANGARARQGQKGAAGADWRAGVAGHPELLGAVAGSRRRACSRCFARTPARPRRCRRCNCRAG